MRILLSISFLFAWIIIEAQDSPSQMQPTIMVIPFVSEGQDLRTILESDLNLRVAVAEVKAGFDAKGLKTIDFRARLKQMQKDEAMELNNQSSIKQEIIALSGADIYVETESTVVLTPTGNSVTLILSAYDAVSGQSLSNKVANSPKFYTENYEKLTQKASKMILDEFIKEIQNKFELMHQEGQSFVLSIGFSDNAFFDMDTEIGENSELLSDIIESWLENNAYKGYYHVQGITATKMIVDEVRVPMIDSRTRRRFTPNRFAVRFRQFLKSLELEAMRDVQGNKIFITIN